MISIAAWGVYLPGFNFCSQKSLHLAFNGVFDLMDSNALMMLKTNLQEASREMFKEMLAQYEKYHKYTGKV